jgi:hypothetical protein
VVGLDTGFALLDHQSIDEIENYDQTRPETC